MQTRLVTRGTQTYLECLPDEERIKSDAQALELVAACGEYQTDRLLIHAASLPEAFYDLHSGLAGAILLKFSNYRVRAAFLLSPQQIKPGHFSEMAAEANRGQEFRIFFDLAAAEAWLLDG